MLRIACDLDGTVADMDSAVQREAMRLFGREVELRGGDAGLEVPTKGEEGQQGDALLTRAKGLTGRQMQRLWNHISQIENFWSSLPEIEPGSVARFAALTSLHRWEVIFLTQRPATAGDTSQLQSQKWLQAHGFALPAVYVMNGSRGKLASAFGLHAVLDDRTDNCLDVVAESKAKPILIWRGAPEVVPPGATRLGLTPVFSFAAALVRLEEMMTAKTKRRNLAGRARKAIGLS
ncbi:MAG: hypothetical protein ABL993_06845 [Vicinamibacterales bacterium]